MQIHFPGLESTNSRALLVCAKFFVGNLMWALGFSPHDTTLDVGIQQANISPKALDNMQVQFVLCFGETDFTGDFLGRFLEPNAPVDVLTHINHNRFFWWPKSLGWLVQALFMSSVTKFVRKSLRLTFMSLIEISSCNCPFGLLPGKRDFSCFSSLSHCLQGLPVPRLVGRKAAEKWSGWGWGFMQKRNPQSPPQQ